MIWAKICRFITDGVTGAVEHMHEWGRLPDALGLFGCRLSSCLGIAVCPGCLNSLDIALQVRDGNSGVTLYWCPLHARREGL